MKTFMVERDIGVTPPAELLGMAAASMRYAAQMRDDGDRIYYLGSTYLPLEGRCLCMFEAKNADVVAEHSRAAHLPVQRIVGVVTLGQRTLAPVL